MKSSIVSRRTLSMIVCTGCVLFLTLLFYFVSEGLSKNNLPLPMKHVVVPAEQEQSKYGLPVTLTIPKINIDTSLTYVGLTPDGAMDIPKNQDEVVWFKLGPRPGENGSAVIAGHYGWKNGVPSAFDNLYTLRKGDKLYIEDDKGIAISFVVRESRRYDPNADASDVFSSDDGKAHLNLVTCEGVWDTISKTYSKRLVVFTDKE